MIQQGNNRNFLIYFFLCSSSFFVLFFSYIFVFDPWQLFHPPWFRDTVFIENSRFQNAGIINSYDFDSIILGTSIAQNFSNQEASQLFKSSFVNLSMKGGLFSERAIILERVLQKKDLKTVILSLDFQLDFSVGESNKDIPRDQYDFLYNSNRLDDTRIYMDWSLVKCWNVNNLCYDKLPGKRTKDLENLYHWQSSTSNSQRKSGIQGWCRSSDNPYTRGWIKEVITIADGIQDGKYPNRDRLDKKFKRNLEGTFDAYVEPYIKQYSGVTFYLFFPPYSRLRYALLQQGYQTVFDLYCEYIEYVVNRMNTYDNVIVFGFETAEFPDDLNHYDDVFHYDPEINSHMLHWMAKKEYTITSQNIETYLHDIRSRAQDFDLQATAEEFRECLEEAAAD